MTAEKTSQRKAIGFEVQDGCVPFQETDQAPNRRERSRGRHRACCAVANDAPAEIRPRRGGGAAPVTTGCQRIDRRLCCTAAARSQHRTTRTSYGATSSRLDARGTPVALVACKGSAMKVLVMLSTALLVSAWSATRIGKSHPRPSAGPSRRPTAAIVHGRRSAVSMLLRKHAAQGERP
jgi:hypothetical protein